MVNTDSQNIDVIVERLIQIKQTQTDMRTEFNRAVDEIKADIKDLKKQISDGYATKEELASIDARLKKQESVMEWVGRIIIGAVLAAVLALVLTQK